MPEPSQILVARRIPGGEMFVADRLQHPGSIFWVNSVTGVNAAGYGTGPDRPVATIDYAIGLCTANAGDVIYVMEGHNEGLGDAQIALDVAGVHIIGLGQGSRRPRIDFDHANASIDISASNCRISNLTLLPSVTAVLVAIDVMAGVLNTELDNLETLSGEDGAGVDEFAKTIDIKAGCTGTYVHDSVFSQHLSAAGVISCVALTGASDRVTIRRCTFWCYGAALVAPINGDTTLSTRLLIEDCVFDTDAEPMIEVLTGTTGIIIRCFCRTDIATLNGAIVADAMSRFGCQVAEPAEAGGNVGTATVDD